MAESLVPTDTIVDTPVQVNSHPPFQLKAPIERFLNLSILPFYKPVDGTIIDALAEGDLSEGELNQILSLDTQLLRTRLEVLINGNIIKKSSPGVKSSKYAINYYDIRNTLRCKIKKMRIQMEKEDRVANGNKKYFNKEVIFSCTRCPKTYSVIEIHRIFHPLYKKTMCLFCWGDVVEDTKEFPPPINVIELNKTFEESYKLMDEIEKATKVVDAAEAGTPITQLYQENSNFQPITLSKQQLRKIRKKVSVRIMDKIPEREPLQPKPFPEWFNSRYDFPQKMQDRLRFYEEE